MRGSCRFAGTLGLLALAALPVRAAVADAPAVVASIAPVHSLVAGVMEGVGSVDRLLPPGASPHAYALKPSEAQMLRRADVVFWVGPTLESFLAQPLNSLAGDARVVALQNADGMTLLPARDGGVWEHDHDHGPENGHDDGHGHGDEHGHERKHDHEQADDHPADTSLDTHFWLDPRNGAAWASAIAATLSDIDPANAEAYQANAAKLRDRLETLESRLTDRLSPVAETPYLVFHDAYQYFEARFDLTPVGAITVSPEIAPGARRVSELRDLVRERNAACVFSEPQFEPRLVAVVIEGTGAGTAVLDPLGTEHPAGPDQYFQMLEDLGNSLAGCLTR